MSTFYFFTCEKHQLEGGHLSRQAWGVGNFDIVDTFKFLMHHALECGPDQIRMRYEYDETGYPNTNQASKVRAQHLQDTAGIFPHSDDFKWMLDFVQANGRRPKSEMDAAWIEHEQRTNERLSEDE